MFYLAVVKYFSPSDNDKQRSTIIKIIYSKKNRSYLLYLSNFKNYLRSTKYLNLEYFDAYYKVVDTVGFEPMNAGTKKDGQAIYN